MSHTYDIQDTKWYGSASTFKFNMKFDPNLTKSFQTSDISSSRYSQAIVIYFVGSHIGGLR